MVKFVGKPQRLAKTFRPFQKPKPYVLDLPVLYSVQFPYKKFIGLHELGSHTEASTATSMIPRDNLFGINLSRNLKKDTRQTPRPNLNRLNLSPSKVDQVSPKP